MRRLTAILAALALAAAAGCGGDDDQGEPIPAQEGQDLLTLLDQIEGNVESGACQGAESKIVDRDQLQDKVAALPDDVDADVRSALEDGVDRLLELVEEQCGEDEEPTDTTETEAPPETEETQPPETEETEETQPPETEETQPPETQETQPPPETEEEPPPPGDDGGTGPGAGGDGGGTPSPNAGAGAGRGSG